MGLFSGGNSSSSYKVVTDSSGIQAGGDATRVDRSTIADNVISAGGTSTVNYTPTDFGAIQSASEIISKQLDVQRDLNLKAVDAQRQFQALAIGDIAAARTAATEDAAKARQADGGRSDRLITTALIVVGVIGTGLVLRGMKQ